MSRKGNFHDVLEPALYPHPLMMSRCAEKIFYDVLEPRVHSPPVFYGSGLQWNFDVQKESLPSGSRTRTFPLSFDDAQMSRKGSSWCSKTKTLPPAFYDSSLQWSFDVQKSLPWCSRTRTPTSSLDEVQMSRKRDPPMVFIKQGLYFQPLMSRCPERGTSMMSLEPVLQL